MRPKVIIISAAVGGGIGTIIAGGYTIAAAVFCIGLRICPVSWIPYVIVFIVAVLSSTLICTIIGVLAYTIYRKYYKTVI